jgi:diadenosine tetraphosphatase ApaH/serine/threonine PP2A family protein phosphatase
MREAIIADIHGNLEALEAVLEDIDTQDIDRIICIGDIIGYGADPEACTDLVSQRCALALKGNHEEAVLTGYMYGFNHVAKKSTIWTQERFEPIEGKWHSFVRWNKNKARKAENRVRQAYKLFLGQLPKEHEENNVLYVHGSPRDPVFEYLFKREVKEFLSQYEVDDYGVTGANPDTVKMEALLELNFDLFDWLCFNAHSHEPNILFQLIGAAPLIVEGASGQIIDKPYGYVLPGDLKGGVYDLTKVKGLAKVIVGVGSVGQPRDDNPNACYVIHDDTPGKEIVEYRRVPYNITGAVVKIKDARGLPNQLADRLQTGT